MSEQNERLASSRKFILGTAGIGGVWNRVDPLESISTIFAALESGIDGIDTAPAYGDGETFVGSALRKWTGGKPKISTKVGRLKGFSSNEGHYDYSTQAMTKSLASSLRTLGVDSLDTLFLHEPDAIPSAQINQAVEAMIYFKQQGYTRRIGLGGNYPTSFQVYVQEGIFDDVMEYNRLNACCLDALDTSLKECQESGVTYWAASPLHMGLLGRRFDEFKKERPSWLPQHFIDSASQVKTLGQRYYLDLPTLSLQFLKQIPRPFNIVIGPSNLEEFKGIRKIIQASPMNKNLYDHLFTLIHH